MAKLYSGIDCGEAVATLIAELYGGADRVETIAKLVMK